MRKYASIQPKTRLKQSRIPCPFAASSRILSGPRGQPPRGRPIFAGACELRSPASGAVMRVPCASFPSSPWSGAALGVAPLPAQQRDATGMFDSKNTIRHFQIIVTSSTRNMRSPLKPRSNKRKTIDPACTRTEHTTRSLVSFPALGADARCSPFHTANLRGERSKLRIWRGQGEAEPHDP